VHVTLKPSAANFVSSSSFSRQVDERTKQGYRPIESTNQEQQKTVKKEQEKEISEEKKQEILNHVKYKSGINPVFVTLSHSVVVSCHSVVVFDHSMVVSCHPVVVSDHPVEVSRHPVVVFGCQLTTDGEKSPPDGIISRRTDQYRC